MIATRDTIGSRLRGIREGELHLTQEEMAPRLRISKATYQAYEHDKRLPDASVLRLLYDEGFDIHWLLAGDGTPRRRPSAAHSRNDPFPGVSTVVDAAGIMHDRLDLIPEVLAPALRWISESLSPTLSQDQWRWAANTLIARYSWDFMTWLNKQKRAETDTAAG